MSASESSQAWDAYQWIIMRQRGGKNNMQWQLSESAILDFKLRERERERGQARAERLQTVRYEEVLGVGTAEVISSCVM